MIHLGTVITKEASRVWGDFIEKEAFEVDVNPVSILAAAAGSYAGTRHYQKAQNKKEEEAVSQKRIENNHYQNIQNVLADLKIVFTPINVIYSVNGQSFEIIKVNEMTPEMKNRFVSRDAEYFKNILVQKMNMELQLAEQIFARRLLQPHLPQAYKQATLVSPWFEKVSEEAFESTEKAFMEKTAEASAFRLEVGFDSLRPFAKNDFFFNPAQFEKVANPIDYFRTSISENYTNKDMQKNVKIGFLPDRVVYLLNGHMIEQLSLMNMNEDGYAAFQKKDKEFFMDFFVKESEKIQNAVLEEVQPSVDFSKLAEEGSVEKDTEEDADETEDEDIDETEDETEDEDGDEKTAATLEEVFADEEATWDDSFAIQRSEVDLFKDHDIHPIIYDRLLDEKIGEDWHLQELEAVLKQVEIDFELTDPIGNRALDKIAMLHTIQNTEHSLFSTAFTFEKFIRAMNNKSVIISDFEGGLELEDILFAFDIAKTLSPDTIFAEFGNTVAPYVSEELMSDGVRFVSDQLFDESDPMERLFWKEVNGFLSRKWKEKDSQGQDEEETMLTNQRTNYIVDVSERILTKSAEHIDYKDPYNSVRTHIRENRILDTLVADEETKVGVESAITQLVGRHFIAIFFLTIKRQEAIKTYERITGEE